MSSCHVLPRCTSQSEVDELTTLATNAWVYKIGRSMSFTNTLFFPNPTDLFLVKNGNPRQRKVFSPKKWPPKSKKNMWLKQCRYWSFWLGTEKHVAFVAVLPAHQEQLLDQEFEEALQKATQALEQPGHLGNPKKQNEQNGPKPLEMSVNQPSWDHPKNHKTIPKWHRYLDQLNKNRWRSTF